MSFNLSELFERVADAVGDRDAIVHAARTASRTPSSTPGRIASPTTWPRPESCAGDRVGLMLLNGTEYIETMLGCFKLRAVPININYRYVERELAYLFADAALVQPRVSPPLRARDRRGDGRRARTLAHLVVVDDGSDVEPVVGSVRVSRRPGRRVARSWTSPAAPVTISTARIPAAPPGCRRGCSGATKTSSSPRWAAAIRSSRASRSPIPTSSPTASPPTAWCSWSRRRSSTWPRSGATFQVLFGGGTAVLPSPGPLDAEEVWSLAARERVHVITVVGDAMARPLLEYLDACPAEQRPDLSALMVFASGGATLSAHCKAEIGRLLPHVIVIDGYGSSETGVAGSEARVGGGGGPARSRFRVDATTAVLDDELRPLAPGSGAVGRLARRGRLPIGYHNDPAKTAATFVTVDGERWALSGDLATVETDGTITFLGRGSATINTGGEKVFAEEVESVIISHPDGGRCGRRRCARTSVGANGSWPSSRPRVTRYRRSTELRGFCQSELAGYKLPKDLVIVETVLRAPSGKPDYPWAKALVTGPGPFILT